MDAIFKALGDETRRRLLDMLRTRDGQTLTELEEQLGMTRFGVMKHLKVLEAASLVVTRRSGRFKYHYLNAVPLQEVIDRWIEPLTQKPMARAALEIKAKLEGTDTMNAMTTDMTKPDYILETIIQTTADKLWAALTEGDHIRQYHFAGASPAPGKLEQGGRLDLMRPDGGLMLGAEILAMDPPKRLDLTFEPGWIENAAHSRCVYEIEEEGETCKLTILHFGIPQGQDGVRDGWLRIASSLKTYLETGQGITFAAAQG